MKVAVLGGGVSGLAAGWKLQRLGHESTAFEADPSPVAILLVAGSDIRFEWSPRLDLMLQLVALAVLALGYSLSGWAPNSTATPTMPRGCAAACCRACGKSLLTHMLVLVSIIPRY